VILASAVLTQYRNVTDGQTDAQTMAKTRKAFHYMLSRVKKNVQKIKNKQKRQE